MKIEKVDVVCIALGLFMLGAYLKLGIVAYLVASVVLIAPVVFFFFRGGLKINVTEEKKHESHQNAN